MDAFFSSFWFFSFFNSVTHLLLLKILNVKIMNDKKPVNEALLDEFTELQMERFLDERFVNENRNPTWNGQPYEIQKDFIFSDKYWLDKWARFLERKYIKLNANQE